MSALIKNAVFNSGVQSVDELNLSPGL